MTSTSGKRILSFTRSPFPLSGFLGPRETDVEDVVVG